MRILLDECIDQRLRLLFAPAVLRALDSIAPGQVTRINDATKQNGC